MTPARPVSTMFSSVSRRRLPVASGIARCCVVEHGHEAGRPAARADVACAVRRVGRDEQHRRRGDQPAAHLVDVADVLAHGPLHRRLVELAQLLDAAEGADRRGRRGVTPLTYARCRRRPAGARTRKDDGERAARPAATKAHAGRPEPSPLSAVPLRVDPKRVLGRGGRPRLRRDALRAGLLRARLRGRLRLLLRGLRGRRRGRRRLRGLVRLLRLRAARRRSAAACARAPSAPARSPRPASGCSSTSSATLPSPRWSPRR